MRVHKYYVHGTILKKKKHSRDEASLIVIKFLLVYH